MPIRRPISLSGIVLYPLPHDLTYFQKSQRGNLGYRGSDLRLLTACSVDDDFGTLEAGKVADMVLLDGDPLVDICNLTKVSRVFKGGEEIQLPLYDLSYFFDLVHE